MSTAIEPGAVVDYHGGKAARHGRYVVAGTVRGRLVLLDAGRPADHRAVLYRVRPASVTPTGGRRPLCAYCHLPADVSVGDCPGHARHVLPCAEHAHPVPATFAPDRWLRLLRLAPP
jgi:hypothetical protein